MSNKVNHLSQLSVQLFRLVAVLGCMLAVSFIYRLIFLGYYGSSYTEWQKYASDLPFGFFQGLRVDTQVSLYFLFPLVALAILSGLFGRKIFSTLARIWSSVALILYVVLLVIDFFYYGYFNSHFSISTFGIIYDDTQAVLQSIWDDYPAVGVTLFLVAFSTALVYLIRWIYRSAMLAGLSKNRLAGYLSFIVLPLVVLLMRGSVSLFPLRNHDAMVSKNNFINMVCVNPVLSLKDAYLAYHSGRQSWDVNEMLHAAGHASAAGLVAEYLHIPANSITGDPLDYLQCTTDHDKFLSENPPHVVFLQMESMGINGLSLQNDSLDILGTLREELAFCLYFPNFLPYTSESTVGTLEGMVIFNISGHVIQSAMEDRPVLSSVVCPFKDAGYETRFVTGAKQGWRDINIFLPTQGFDAVEGKETIKHEVPQAEEEDWGVFDEYMFTQIWQDLQQASKPQLIYGMSITNHSPHRLPRGYSFSGIAINEKLKERLLNDEAYTYKGLSTLRYANDCLGNFIYAIRHSPLAGKVIIAVSGDHPFKGFLKPQDEKPYDKYGVPLILYIPECYRRNIAIDQNRRGAHRDIFPTLFHLALSEASYYNLGCNMLDKKFENNMAVNPSGAIIADEGAIDLQTGRYYKNCGDSTFTLGDDAEAAQALTRRYHLWAAVSRYVTLRSFESK
jgi:phosphoglycerol transferase MdoB-like AlkP superfamily enzyme